MSEATNTEDKLLDEAEKSYEQELDAYIADWTDKVFQHSLEYEKLNEPQPS